MTGWRLGWAIANKDLISKMSALQSQSNSHVTSFVQWAGITAAQLPHSEVQKMVDEFDKRRLYVMGRLDKMKPMITYVRPNGAFYVFINVSPWLSQHKMNDLDFCRELLTKVHVGVVPGSSFGQEGWIRISYATSLSQLEKALNRIEEVLHQ